MVISAGLQSGQVLFPASLVVLTNCCEGVVSSCEDDRTTQVDSTGLPKIKILLFNYLSHLIITE